MLVVFVAVAAAVGSADVGGFGGVGAGVDVGGGSGVVAQVGVLAMATKWSSWL